MYCEFYGFSEKPFDITTDPKFLYVSPSYREALTTIISGLRKRLGLTVLAGEEGVGRRTLVHEALDQLNFRSTHSVLPLELLNKNTEHAIAEAESILSLGILLE